MRIGQFVLPLLLILPLLLVFSMPAMAGTLVFEAPVEEEAPLDNEPLGGSNAKKDNTKRVSAQPAAPAAPSPTPAAAAPAAPQKIQCKMPDGTVVAVTASECKRKQTAGKKK